MSLKENKQKDDELSRSFVISDPTGKLLLKYGQAIKDCGFDIKIFNTENVRESMHYNPLMYLKGEEDIMNFVRLFMKATNENLSDVCSKNESFWVNADRALFNALIGYIYFEAPQREINFRTVAELIRAMEVREDEWNFKNAVDMLFEELEEKDPNHFAAHQYKCYELAPDGNKKSIVADAYGRISSFDFQDMYDLTQDDDLELNQLGKYKTALFIISSDVSHTYDPLIAILYSQLFDVSCKMADDISRHSDKRPLPIEIIGYRLRDLNIPYYDHTISVAKSRGIHISSFDTLESIEKEVDRWFGELQKNTYSNTEFDIQSYLNLYFTKRLPRTAYDLRVNEEKVQDAKSNRNISGFDYDDDDEF